MEVTTKNAPKFTEIHRHWREPVIPIGAIRVSQRPEALRNFERCIHRLDSANDYPPIKIVRASVADLANLPALEEPGQVKVVYLTHVR